MVACHHLIDVTTLHMLLVPLVELPTRVSIMVAWVLFHLPLAPLDTYPPLKPWQMTISIGNFMASDASYVVWKT